MRSEKIAIAVGYLPASFAFGALAISLHMPPWIAILLSMLPYSGALQMAVLGLWAVGASWPLMLFSGFLLNLRHMLYGPHLESSGASWHGWQRVLLSFFLTDEVYAVAVRAEHRPKEVIHLALFAYSAWQIGTVLGIVTARTLPTNLLVPLSFALPTLFLGLLLPSLKKKSGLGAALTGGGIAFLLKEWHIGSSLTVVAILAGAAIGYFLDGRN